MRKEQIGELGKIILGILVVTAGVVTLATFPGLVQLLPKPKRRRKLQPWEIRRAMLRLREKQMIQLLKRKNGSVVRLTVAGRDYFERLEKEKERREKFANLALPGYTPWDGWWRVVTFDIPHKKKILRELLRRKLRSLGFYPLQKSVFVHPSPCENEITFLADFFDARPYIHTIRARRIDPEERIRGFFEV